MSLINASIPNLINGVSQQPPSLRLKTQATLQENARSSVVTGLTKRPGTVLVSTLPDVQDTDNAFIHTIRRDDTEYYTLIITTNEILVFDSEGVERTVTGVSNYFSGLTNPAEELAATTVADYTFLVNKTVPTAKSLDTANQRNKEALIYVKQGDYSCQYTVRITKDNLVYTRTIETMASTQSDTAGAKKAEKSVQTDRIATNLIYENDTESTYYGATTGAVIDGIEFTTFGNVIWVECTDGTDFTIEVEDSRGNQHIHAFKETTADFKKLPPSGPNGFIIGVIGDNDKGQDDYYVALEGDTIGGQIWRETIKPEVDLSFDVSTMPHQLISNADGTFTVQPANYKERKVGDDDTNPFPSFTGLPINDIFFHKNRLGFLADENVILSESGEFTEFNFFKRTTLTLLDSDPIDAAVSNNKVSILKHAVPFNESLLMFSELTQFRLSSTDLLTPETISVDVTTQFEANLRAKPVGAGRYVFFTTSSGAWSGVREYFVDTDADVDDASNITAHVPEYIPGDIRKMEASSNEDMLVCLSSEDTKSMYVYSYYWQGREKLQASWSRWTFEGDVLNVSFNKSDINLLVRYTTANGPVLTLERISLSVDEATTITAQQHPILLDRRQIWDSNNEIDTPFTPSNGEQTLYVTNRGVPVSETVARQRVEEGEQIFVGVPYLFRYIFSEQVIKSNDELMTTGRLQLRNMTLVYNDTGVFKVLVTPKGRDTKENQFTGRIIGSLLNKVNNVAIETGHFRFPVLAKSDEVTIEIQSNSHLPVAFQRAEWEGYFVMRSQRL